MTKNTIYVYVGPNVARPVSTMLMDNFAHAFAPNGLRVKPLTPAQILEGTWAKDAFALVWGGGEATQFRKALTVGQDFRKEAIVEAHNNGTHFVGFCGGAYLGMEHIVFEGAEGYRRQGEGFGLWPQRSPGPVIGLTPSAYSSNSDSAAIVQLHHKDTGRNFASLYCCGPYFPENALPQGAKTLATTSHPVTGQDYIMGVQMPAAEGRGSVTLYGYHPDFTTDFIIHRTKQAPSIESLAMHDRRLQREAHDNRDGILMGFNLMLRDLKSGMGLEYGGKYLIRPAREYPYALAM